MNVMIFFHTKWKCIHVKHMYPSEISGSVEECEGQNEIQS